MLVPVFRSIRKTSQPLVNHTRIGPTAKECRLHCFGTESEVHANSAGEARKAEESEEELG